MNEQELPNPHKRRQRLIAGGAVALAVLGGGMGAAAARSNPSPSTTSASSKAAQSQQDQDNKADPSLNSSVTAPEAPDVESASEADDTASDAAEQAALAKLAKVTPDEAKAAALKAVPGSAATPALSNESGNVVYDVEVTSADGKTQTDVKVDAGNAKVLAQGTGDNEHDGNDASDKPEQPGTETNDAPATQAPGPAPGK